MRQGFLFSAIVSIVFCASVWGAGGVLPGAGTDTDPYLIEDVNDFDAFASNSAYWAAGVHTKLMTDIDLSGRTYTTAVIAPDTDVRNWAVAGMPFSGIFNGNNLIIRNLSIDTAGIDYDCLGLFGRIEGATAKVENLCIQDMTIAGGSDSFAVGGLAGLNISGGTVTNCSSSGSVNGFYHVGGLVGQNISNSIVTDCHAAVSVTGSHCVGGLTGSNDSTITACYSTGNTTGTGNSTGGLVGENVAAGVLSNCYSTGLVNGGRSVGGLVGWSDASVMGCFSTGSIGGTLEEVGGLIGWNGGTVTNCYSTGSITGDDYYVGGLIGYNNGSITYCYSTGFVSGFGGDAGGLVGWSIGNVMNSFWDVETSGIADPEEGLPDTDGIIGKTTTEMMTQGTFAGWDFLTPVWVMQRPGEDYPRLAWQADLGGGDGSQANPYLIENIYDFDRFSSDPNYWAAGVHTKLMTDIDLAGRTYTTAVIAPDTDNQTSGYQGASFAGIFDGNDRTIHNLTIDTTGVNNDYLGLFGRIDYQGAVHNLSLENAVINAPEQYNNCAGSLCGFNDSGSVLHCYATGSLNGYYNVGGLIGVNYNDGTVNNCYSRCDVTGYRVIGGLLGVNDSNSLSNCYSTGNISGNKDIGGLVGYNSSHSIIAECCAIGNVSGEQSIGGLVGGNYGLVTNCYSSGSVDGDSRVGGLVGESDNDGFIEYSYSTGSVSGNSYVGGVVGWTDLGAWKSFWDVETSGIEGPGEEYFEGIGITTEQMQTLATFTDAGWDFSDDDGDPAVWMMLRAGEDYPRLAWQETFMGDIAGLYGVDLVDFAEIARNWQHTGCPGNCEDADIDGSGDVGLSDLAVVANDWLK